MKAERVQLYLLCSITLLNFVGVWMIRLLVPLYAYELGAGYTVVGIIVGAFAGISLLFAVPAGGIVDRFGVKPTLLVGFAGVIFSWLLVVLLPGAVTLLISQAVGGVAQLATIVASQTAVAFIGDDRERETNYGLYSTFTSIGQMLGPLIGGVVADLTHYRWAFLVGAIVCMMAGGLSALMEPIDVGIPDRARKASRHGWNEIRSILTNDTMRLSILACFAAVFTQGSRTSIMPLYLAANAFNSTGIAIIIGIQSAAAIVVRLFMGWAVDWLGRFWLLVNSMILLAIGTILFPLVGSNLILLTIVSVAIGFGFGLTQPVTMVMVADSAAEGQRGLAMGVRLTGNRSAQTINPLAMGAIADLGGFRMSLISSGLFLAAMLWPTFHWRKGLQSPRDLPSHQRPETTM